ncbi:MAG: EAL domain-containing protein [Leptolyngbyaceae cyanobacterium bins.302]|nr:EAL domain-containing protein [Leptolyngbyaceae cyanobacterium bins.302]
MTQADILIVDDIPENIRLLSGILDAKGYQTRKATNGETALRAIEAMLPSLVLLDIRMPKMSGYEVCRRLKSNPKTTHIPVIFLSAADEIADKVEAFGVGGADYITKPFHVEEVLARVHHQLTILAAQQTIWQLNTQLEARVKERTHQLELANSKLSEMAFCDPLTQLPNRAFLMQRLQNVLNQPEQQNLQNAVLYLDCDRFKTVNDSLGHQAGDELLIAISQRLKSVLRQVDLLVRLGGDEFVILLSDLPDAVSATDTAERILNSFTSPFYLREREFFVSFSIGIVSSCSTYKEPEDLLRDADTAMYQAKAAGKDCYQIFEISMYEAVCQRLQLETDLRKALRQQELSLFYQPIVDLATETVVGLEALVRWHHPTLGLVPPDQFIPIAEETGMILKLGLWVLEAACRQLVVWQTQGMVDADFFVSVNVSAYQFAQRDFIEQLDRVLTETQMNPYCLKLEITETVIMQNFVSAAEVIHQLRERAIQLSIDDFGTGYSSLSYLHSFPVDYLKIDRSFTQRLHREKSSLSLVTAIIQIAQTMGIQIVAEGIETSDQLAQLKLLGCRYGQGFFFSKPLPVNQIIDFLSPEAYQIK